MTMTGSDPDSARRFWLAFAAGFLLLGAAWTALFLAAHRAQVESVPLASPSGRTAP